MFTFLNLRSVTELDRFMSTLKLSQTRSERSTIMRGQDQSSSGPLGTPVEDKNPLMYAECCEGFPNFNSDVREKDHILMGFWGLKGY